MPVRSMRVLTVHAHPDPVSFCHAVRGRVALAVAVALAFALASSMGPLNSTPRVAAANPAATVIARYRARIRS